MSDPRPEHVAAIERRTMGWTATRGAQRLLITTDPDVLDAFLDALVRAGRLTEDRESWRCGTQCSTWSHYYEAHCGEACRLSGRHTHHECVVGHTWPYDERLDGPQSAGAVRYVTEWQKADQ